MNIVMILPELLLNLIQLFPNTISLLLVISKIHYNIITKYINHLIFICNKENNKKFEKLLYFFIDHDIIYGFVNLINDTNHLMPMPFNYIKYLIHLNYIKHSCKMNSHRILSFLFKYNNYHFVKLVIPVPLKWPEHMILLLFIENFSRNGLMHHLNKLIVGNKYSDDMLGCFCKTLEKLSLMPINNKINDITVKLFFNYVHHYNLSKAYLLNFAQIGIFTYKSVCNLLEFRN